MASHDRSQLADYVSFCRLFTAELNACTDLLLLTRSQDLISCLDKKNNNDKKKMFFNNRIVLGSEPFSFC